MANAQKKNIIYIDATGTVTVGALRPVLFAILVTPSAATGRFTLKESVSGTVVVDILFSTLESKYISFVDGNNLHGIELSQSFEIATLTTIASAQLIGRWDLPTGRAR